MTANMQTYVQSHEHNAMKPQPKWQDWSILVLSGILFTSPWIFGTATQTSSSWNAWLVSIGLGFLTGRTFLPPPGGYAMECAHEGRGMAWWQMIINVCKLSHIAKEELVVGAWLLVAPWLLGFTAVGAASSAAWFVGILVTLLAVWKLRELRGQ